MNAAARIKSHIASMGMIAMLCKGAFDAVLAVGALWAGHMMFALACAGGATFWAVCCAAMFTWQRKKARKAQPADMMQPIIEQPAVYEAPVHEAA